MRLRLEYCCTDAETKEAQSLHLRQHYGGGSKFRTRLILFGWAALVAATLFWQFKTKVYPQDRIWFLSLAAAVYLVILLVKRMGQRRPEEPVCLEISDEELVFNSSKGRTTLLWSNFSHCLESSNLFVLVDQSKTILYIIPKRAFPDERALSWFRTQGMLLANKANATSAREPFPDELAALNGIPLTFQLKYRDYLSRSIASWRIKGVWIGVLMLVVAIGLLAPTPPDAVVQRGKALMIMLSIFLPMWLAMIFVITFLSWNSDKKVLKKQQVVLTREGIEFLDSDSSSRLFWSTYKFYHENRWSFFVWQPTGSLWLMLPKRAFASTENLGTCRDYLKQNLTKSQWFFL